MMSRRIIGECLRTTDYHDQFDTESYLATYVFFEVIPSFDNLIKELVRLFIKNREKLLHGKALEFGGGPTLMSSFILAQCVDSIRFVDYTPNNIKAVKSWMDKTSEAHDWSSLFQAIIEEYHQQDGISADTINQLQWEEKLRKALEHGGLCTCVDVNSNEFCPVLDGESKESYDVILSAFCLEDACLTLDIFRKTIGRLGDLLKANGILFLVHGRNQSFYCVGMSQFFALSINEDVLRETLSNTGFTDIKIICIEKSPDAHADADGFMIATAHKRQY